MASFPASVVAYVEATRRRAASVPDALDRWGGVASASGAVWLLLAGIALALASVVPWLILPLMRSWRGAALPVFIGWGPRVGAINYAQLVRVMALVFCARALLAFDWRRFPLPSGRYLGDYLCGGPHPPRPGTLVALGMAALGIAALFIYQLICADSALATLLAAQERDALLIRARLGYGLPAQHLRMLPFQVEAATPGDRFALLVQLADIGLVLPALAGLLCFYGAYHSRRAQAARHAAPLTRGNRWKRAQWKRGQPRSRRWLLWGAVGVGGVAVVALGRAPAGLAFEQAGRQAIAAGEYRAALTDFDRAQALNPALDRLPSFHRERGQALYLVHQVSDRDVGLYLTQQYRLAGSLAMAWQEDMLLRQRFPQDALVADDQALTAELALDRSMRAAQLPLDLETAQQRPASALEPFEQPLAWAEQLLRLQPNNLYGHYLRGRLLFALRSYDQAATDFRTLLRMSSDGDLKSAGATYLAFCSAGQGDYAGERALLRMAIKLDHDYNNTTAREAASGFH